MTDNGHDEGAWLSLHEAARRLNLTPQTIRRRLKRGEFETRQVPTRTGLAYQVRLASRPDLSDQANHQPVQQASGQTSLEGLGEMVALVRDLQAELLRRTEAATAWQLRAEMLAGQVQQLQAALEAPKAAHDEQTSIECLGELNATVMAPEPTPPDGAVSRPSTRRWWRFWGS